MTPPVIQGEPKIEAQESGSVLLEVMVRSGSAPTVVWKKDDVAIAEGPAYKFSQKDDGGGRFSLFCEILNFDKPLAGLYKADFSNADGGNSATFTVEAGNAPEFADKPHIVQRNKGAVLAIKVRGVSKIPGECWAEWFKDDKPVKETDRVKLVVKKDHPEKDNHTFALEITSPIKEDEAKYMCVLKNAEGQNAQSLNLVFD